MIIRTWRFLSVTVWVGLSLVMSPGCTDDLSLARVNNDKNSRNIAVKGEPPKGSSLQHLEPCDSAQVICAASLNFTALRLLRVKLVDGNGVPVRNTEIIYNIEQTDADGVSLSAARGVTNEEGVSESGLRSGTDSGSVKVSVRTADVNVKSLEFIISVNPKGASSYNVSFAKFGHMDPEKVEVVFFADDVTCSQYMEDVARERDNDPATHPVLTAQYAKLGQALADGTLPIVQLANVPNGTAYTVGARAFLRGNDEVEIALGCSDNNPAVNSGTHVDVTLPLVKHIPKVIGDYKVIHTFDLVEGLPPNVKLVVDLLGTLVSDPGAFIVGCSTANDASCAFDTEGLVGVLLNVLPDPNNPNASGPLLQLRQAIDSFLGSNLGKGVVRNIVNNAFEGLIDGDRLPSWVGNGVHIVRDITETLSHFEVEGTIRIRRQPEYVLDDEGFPVRDGDGNLMALWSSDTLACREGMAQDCNEQIWENLSFFWRRGCTQASPPECGKETIGATSLGNGGSFVNGYFNGSLMDARVLHVDEHTLKLNYGLLILKVVEKVVLPSVFGANAQGQPIDSIERVLDFFISSIASEDNSSLTGCAALADRVNVASSIVKNLCEQLLQQAGDGLRKYVTDNLVLDGQEAFLVATPEGKGCNLLQPSTYHGDWPSKPLPYVEQFGQDSPDSKRCIWNVKLKFSEDNTTNIPGKFHGQLK